MRKKVEAVTVMESTRDDERGDPDPVSEAR